MCCLRALWLVIMEDIAIPDAKYLGRSMDAFLQSVRWCSCLGVFSLFSLMANPLLAAWQVSESKLTISDAAADNNFGRSNSGWAMVNEFVL